MRRMLLVGSIAVAMTVPLACASTDDDPAKPPASEPDASKLGEASTPEPGDAATEIAPIPPCSKAGWCPTALPDVDLVFKEVWPFPERAFAIAESATRGVKILEWEDSEAKWKYIDDNSQNEGGMGHYAGRMWAPSANEIYYGVAYGMIEHGTRPSPGAAWTWEHASLVDNSPDVPFHPEHDHGHFNNLDVEIPYPTLGAWGIGGDVYAWYANTIFRWSSEGGGPPGWVEEYRAADVEHSEEHIFFIGAAGSTPDEVWFIGSRDFFLRVGNNVIADSCPLIVRKTSGGYQRIFDAYATQGCAKRPDLLALRGAPGWLMDVQGLPGNRFVGIKGGTDIDLISPGGSDGYSITSTNVPADIYSLRQFSLVRPFYSVYFPSDGQPWLSGIGVVIRGDDVWGASATYGVSTLSLNGGPIVRPMYQIRGTSDTNLWAVGARYALHKTTP